MLSIGDPDDANGLICSAHCTGFKRKGQRCRMPLPADTEMNIEEIIDQLARIPLAEVRGHDSLHELAFWLLCPDPQGLNEFKGHRNDHSRLEDLLARWNRVLPRADGATRARATRSDSGYHSSSSSKPSPPPVYASRSNVSELPGSTPSLHATRSYHQVPFHNQRPPALPLQATRSYHDLGQSRPLQTYVPRVPAQSYHQPSYYQPQLIPPTSRRPTQPEARKYHPSQTSWDPGFERNSMYDGSQRHCSESRVQIKRSRNPFRRSFWR